jgi:hypothetical protein
MVDSSSSPHNSHVFLPNVNQTLSNCFLLLFNSLNLVSYQQVALGLIIAHHSNISKYEFFAKLAQWHCRIGSHHSGMTKNGVDQKFLVDFAILTLAGDAP